MFDRLEILRMAGGLASHASERQAVVARNVANADTPGYRAEDLERFADVYRASGGPDLRKTRDGHVDAPSAHQVEARRVDAGGPAAPNGNTVALEDEMIRAVEVKRGHDIALAVYRTSLDLMRASLGRGR
jgi:flagellar basal-body rod protein FlgB